MGEPMTVDEALETVDIWHSATDCSHDTPGCALAAEVRRLRQVEQAALEWTEARKEDGRITGQSVIPTAQRLINALEAHN